MSPDVPIIARRKTYDDQTVLAFADGYVTYRNGQIIAKGLNRQAMLLFLGDVGLYSGDEAKMLATAAKRGVAKYPNDLGDARQYMRTLAGPALKQNPISTRDYIFIGTGILSAIAIVIEMMKKSSSTTSSANTGSTISTGSNDQVFWYDGQVIDVQVGDTITAAFPPLSPAVNFKLASTTTVDSKTLKAGAPAIAAPDANNTSGLFTQKWTALKATSGVTLAYVPVNAAGQVAGPSISAQVVIQ